MTVDHEAEAAAFRAEVREFLAESLPADWKGPGVYSGEEYLRFMEGWRATLNARGWRAPTWPKQFGGAGLSELQGVVLAEELANAGLPAEEDDEIGIQMLGNTLMMFGTDEQKAYFLPRALSGEHVWCQGFSEPEAGSDLAAVRTTARLDGDSWVLNGQKIWTSAAHVANWIFVLARSDRESTRHRGLVFLLVPLDQPGIQVRPIENPMGRTGFSEVFLTDARTARENVLGEPGEGWRVALTLLNFERGASAVSYSIRFRTELAQLAALVREYGRDRDPVIRQRLGRCVARVEVLRYFSLQAAARAVSGEPPGSESSIFGIYWSEHLPYQRQLAMDVLGEAGLISEGRDPQGDVDVTDQAGAPNSTASWQYLALSSLAGTIYGGTSEIQRSIIGERVLGLPREPRPTST